MRDIHIAKDPLAAKRSVGYVPQELSLFPFLTGREVLELVAAARGLSSAPSELGPVLDGLLARFGLTAAQHRMTRQIHVCHAAAAQSAQQQEFTDPQVAEICLVPAVLL